MSQPLLYLTNITIILIIGIGLTIIAKKLKISNLLLLVLAGVALNKLGTTSYHIEFNPVFLTSISILALVMIVFESCSMFKLKELDEFSIMAIKTTLVWLVLNLILLTGAFILVFKEPSILMALMFAALMSGTAPSSMLSMFKGTENRIAKFLEVEAIVNTPLIVIIPFIILGFIGKFSPGDILPGLVGQIGPFLQQFVAGIGAGILVGIVAFKIMSGKFPENLSPLSIMTASIFTYILAENLGGNGVLAVTTLGLFFGNLFKKDKEHLIEYSSMFANILIILVFILIGLSVDMPLNLEFLGKSLILFLVYLVIRFIAIMITFRNVNYKLKEKIFLSLNAQKGIALATVAFSMTTFMLVTTKIVDGAAQTAETPFISIPGATVLLSLIIAFIVYSLIFSTIVQKVSKYFIGEIVVPEDEADIKSVKKK